MSVLCFTAKSNNEGFENPFPDGLESESFIVYVIARAYDRSGAYANGSCQVVVCSILNKNLILKLRFMILQLVSCILYLIVIRIALFENPTIKNLLYF